MNRRHFLRTMVGSVAAVAVSPPDIKEETIFDRWQDIPFTSNAGPAMEALKVEELVKQMIKMIYSLPTAYISPPIGAIIPDDLVRALLRSLRFQMVDNSQAECMDAATTAGDGTPAQP